MSDKIKFTDEEMDSLRDLQTSYTEKQAELGQLSVQRILLNQELNSLDEKQAFLENQYVSIQQKEKDLVKKLNDKYGQGQLDQDTGIFTPNKS
tara:strand:- start:2288 stop:2566 length:279 start_codon:yes stop_codon:yes gene_type:complete